MAPMLHVTLHNMFSLSLPVLEKLVRPWIVFLALVIFLRIFGKRELAQLNPFDLVVLLSLSNTVQNAIIGDDNSVTGGLIGAFSLLTVNWLLSSLLYKAPKLSAAFEGSATTLIRHGKIDSKAVNAEKLSHEDLISVLNKNGFSRPEEVELCVLEPNGTFYLKGVSPSATQNAQDNILEAVEALQREIAGLRKELRDAKSSPRSG